MNSFFSILGIIFIGLIFGLGPKFTKFATRHLSTITYSKEEPLGEITRDLIDSLKKEDLTVYLMNTDNPLLSGLASSNCYPIGTWFDIPELYEDKPLVVSYKLKNLKKNLMVVYVQKKDSARISAINKSRVYKGKIKFYVF